MLAWKLKMSGEVLRGKIHSISSSSSPCSFETIMHAHQFLLINDCVIENYAKKLGKEIKHSVNLLFQEETRRH